MTIIYGGAFNPFTLAHEKIINSVIKVFNPKEIIIVPVGDHYNKPELASFSHRKNMIKLVFKQTNVLVSDLEMVAPFKGTVDVLKKISKTKANVWLLIGADNLLDLKNWLQSSYLIENFQFLIVNRNQELTKTSITKLYPSLKYEFLDLDFFGSASLVRDSVETNKNLLNRLIYEYIIANKLYKSQ